MAKRRAVRDYRKSKRRPVPPVGKPEATPTLWQAVTVLHPTTNHPPEKRRVSVAHMKHASVDMTLGLSQYAQPTLADRFNALPGEIRSHIFSLLLVKPVKWDVEHRNCPLETMDAQMVPEHPSHERWSSSASCPENIDVARWRRSCRLGLNIFESPWRSTWAPPQLNPYVCSLCYDERLREEPFPKPVTLPCLCARRQNLQILLVCKKWYAEAATVFYTQNVFAFEDLSTFVEFVRNLNPRWRQAISKISVMTLTGDLPSATEERTADTSSKQWLSRTWHQINNLPSLSYLELDTAFLTHPKAIRALLRLRLFNVRQLRFVTRISVDHDWGKPAVWPALAGRKLAQGGFAEEVARAVKGQRECRLRGLQSQKAIKEGVGQAQAEQRALSVKGPAG